jgi:hypothetical protein
VGIDYALDSKTVIRAASGIVYSQGGGTGGGRTAGGPGGSNGAGQALGFNTTAQAANDTLTGANAGPSFWLNGSNSSLFGPGFAYPTAPTPGAASAILNTGNYLNANGAVVTAGQMGYDDPYAGGRAPMYTFWNLAIERTLTKDITLQSTMKGTRPITPGTAARRMRADTGTMSRIPFTVPSSAPSTDQLQRLNVSLLTAPATTANVPLNHECGEPDCQPLPTL